MKPKNMTRPKKTKRGTQVPSYFNDLELEKVKAIADRFQCSNAEAVRRAVEAYEVPSPPEILQHRF